MIITLLRQEGFVTTEALVQHFNWSSSSQEAVRE
ncbi:MULTISPECIES: DeoR family transcriptional regulator [Gammaproteobacteria]